MADALRQAAFAKDGFALSLHRRSRPTAQQSLSRRTTKVFRQKPHDAVRVHGITGGPDPAMALEVCKGILAVEHLTFRRSSAIFDQAPDGVGRLSGFRVRP